MFEFIEEDFLLTSFMACINIFNYDNFYVFHRCLKSTAQCEQC